MSFDSFFLAVESRDLSQADKSIIRVSSFPKLSHCLKTTTHGKFTRKRKREKISNKVWFNQGWALQLGAGLERNTQWSLSVQIWGCQRPLRLLKKNWRTRKSSNQRSESFSCLLAVLIHKVPNGVKTAGVLAGIESDPSEKHDSTDGGSDLSR